MKRLLCSLCLFNLSLMASPPLILNHQGRISENGVNIDGLGYFKFALVSATGTESYWSNDNSNLGSPVQEPTDAVEVSLSKGHYNVVLGNTALKNMDSDILSSLFADHDDVRLRIWFSSSPTGSYQVLSPDRRISPAGYAHSAGVAETVKDQAVSATAISAPSTENQLLRADGSGGATWTSLQNLLIETGHLQNFCDMEISGIVSFNAAEIRIIQGPGYEIQDISGSPSQSGNNVERDIIFEYEATGSKATALSTWFSAPSNRDASIVVRDALGAESYRWNLFNMQLHKIETAPGGKNRYTLRCSSAANNILEYQRSPTNWQNSIDRAEGDVYIEISGIGDFYGQASINEKQRTLTISGDYSETEALLDWANDIATQGTSSQGLRDMTVVYHDKSGTEIGRNNFYNCFPIRYQQIDGFGQDIFGKEEVVISYDLAQNANATLSSPLPLFNFFEEQAVPAVTVTDAFRYENTKSSYARIHTHEFIPQNGDGTPTRSTAGYLYLASDLNVQLHAPVQLPHGAVITEVAIYYYDNSNSVSFTDVDFLLRQSPNSQTSTSTIAQVSNLNSSAEPSSTTGLTHTISGLNHVVNNKDHSISAWIRLTVDGTSTEVGFKGCRITYSVDEVLP